LPVHGARNTDVVCLGHALVDRLAEATPDVVTRAGLELGAMTLVDGEKALEIERAHDGWEEVAGGSAANTAAGIASLGGSPAFAGSIGADELGRRYVANLEASGVRCVALPVASGQPTGVCHVLVGHDGERSMATNLGAAGELGAPAVEEAGIGESLVVYVEGYLLDAPAAAEALAKATELARGSGTLVALSLSDPFVVERHRDRVLELIGEGTVDILFGNEEETRSLTGAQSLEEGLLALKRPGMLAIVTLGAGGSVAVSTGGRIECVAHPVDSVVDTTGAGDLFAAGVLYGITRGDGLARALRVGSLAASEIIGHLGARPRVSLAGLVEAL
ncbi:MAG: adenosine kinase, partial [Acidimicrobiales bacterium]